MVQSGKLSVSIVEKVSGKDTCVLQVNLGAVYMAQDVCASMSSPWFSCFDLFV